MGSPWEAYAAGSEMEHFAEWCERRLIQFVDRWAGMPLVLEDFHRRFFGEALSYDADGLPIWSDIVLVVPRKNAKTTALGALSIYRLLTTDGNPEILLAASSDVQAGKLFDTCATFVRKNPWLSDRIRVRDHVGQLVRSDGFGKVLRMTSNWRAGHGFNPSLVICDELHTWTTPTLRKMWAALKTGDAARSAPQMFTISTAGDARDRDAPILGELLNGVFAVGDVEEHPGLKIGRDFDGRTLVYNYEAPLEEGQKARIRKRQPTDDDIETLKIANPASWVTPPYLLKKVLDKGLPISDLLQLHGCIWAEGADDWMEAGVWGKLKRRITIEPGAAATFGFDGSSYRDSTVLIGCLVEPRHLWVEAMWERPDRAPEDWKIPRGEIRDAVEALQEKYEVLHLFCDPPHWHEQIEAWGEMFGKNSRGDTVVVAFPTNRPSMMGPACSKFEIAAREAVFTHDGDARLATHIANAKAKDSPHGKFILKEYEDSPRRVDAAVGAVLAYEAMSMVKPKRPNVMSHW